jgi:hypothetical protein
MIWRILCLSGIHFAAWFGTAVVAFGPDLDRLSTRSAVASAVAPVCALLQYPHDVLLHTVPISWLQQAPAIALVVVVLSSLLWSAALFGVWQLLRALAQRIQAAHGHNAA